MFCSVLCGAVVIQSVELVIVWLQSYIYCWIYEEVGWEFASRNDSASDVVNSIGAKIELVIFVRFRL